MRLCMSKEACINTNTDYNTNSKKLCQSLSLKVCRERGSPLLGISRIDSLGSLQYYQILSPGSLQLSWITPKLHAGIMPPLKRSNSCTDIGFTLRRQFHKDDFRWVADHTIFSSFRHLTNWYSQASSTWNYRSCSRWLRCIRSSCHIVWQEFVLSTASSYWSRQQVVVNCRNISILWPCFSYHSCFSPSQLDGTKEQSHYRYQISSNPPSDQPSCCAQSFWYWG
jgi:hypothetical protein